jgi:hypothetical protein
VPGPPTVVSNPLWPNQQGSSPFNQPYATQLNFGQMIREVQNWNPSVDPFTAARMLNNVYRAIIDRRSWYGLKVRGQLTVATPYSTGTVTVTNGSNIVTGIGTTWTQALVGQQFRINFTYQYSTIISVDVGAQTLTLDFPFAGNTQTSGYMILQAYFALDGNIKRMLWAVNQLMGWPMVVNALPVELVNAEDVWRTYQGWSTHFVTRPPTPSGQYQIEIWPAPFQQQTFPFEAYTQPPDMQLDTDSPVAFIDSDAIVLGGTYAALMYRPKQNTYYDPAMALQVAQMKKAEFDARVEMMEQKDNDIDQRNVMWDYDASGIGFGGEGSYFAQSHDV